MVQSQEVDPTAVDAVTAPAETPAVAAPVETASQAEPQVEAQASASAPPEAESPSPPRPDIVFVPGNGSAAPAQPAVVPTPPERIADYIIVDKSDRNLVLYRKGKEIRRFEGIRFGDSPFGHKQFQGDERTPEGLYYIEGRNPGSRFHLSLKISYPNENDRAFARAYGRDPGGDIFIHGQPNGYAGPVMRRDWTDGCIALSNAEIRELWSMVPDGIPILIQV